MSCRRSPLAAALLLIGVEVSGCHEAAKLSIHPAAPAPDYSHYGYGLVGPSGSVFWKYYSEVSYAQYPDNGAHNLQLVADRIGASTRFGSWIATRPNCAARLSFALDRSGLQIEGPSPPVWHNEDKNNYIAGAAVMMNFLVKKLGKPAQKTGSYRIDPSSTAFLNSIRLGDGVAIFASGGHVGVLRRGYTDPYFGNQGCVYIWRLPK